MDSPLATDCPLALTQRMDYTYVLPRAQMVAVHLVRVQMVVVLRAGRVAMAVLVRALVPVLTVERAGSAQA